MNETLFPYQKTGVAWLQKRKTALLADEMGLGKSAQVIIAADNLHLHRVLILCPAIGRVNWLREFQKFSGRHREFALINTRKAFIDHTKSIVCSYDLSHNYDPSILGNFDLLILDEVHYLKSTQTKRTHAIFGKKGFVRYAKHIWALSGTPAPNHPGELWPLLFTFGKTTLPYEEFVKRYCESIQTSYGLQITGSKRENIPELRRVLETCMLRRRAEEVLKELPEIFYSDIVVEPGVVNLDIESSFVQFVFPNDRKDELKELLEKERKLIESTTGAAGFGKDGMKILEGLASSIATLRRYTGLQKVQETAELIKQEFEAGTYEKLVIFAVHRDVIEGFRTRLHKYGPVTLYGGTPPVKRQKNIDLFQNNPKCKVFIGNIQASGTSVTLTASNQVIFAEQDWTPGNNAQAAKRCHRIGQIKPVFVRMVGLANSFDERIAHILRRKTKELTQLFDGQNI